MLWTLIWLVIFVVAAVALVGIINAFRNGGDADSKTIKEELKFSREINAIQENALIDIAGGMAGNPVQTAQAALDDARRIRYSSIS